MPVHFVKGWVNKALFLNHCSSGFNSLWVPSLLEMVGCGSMDSKPGWKHSASTFSLLMLALFSYLWQWQWGFRIWIGAIFLLPITDIIWNTCFISQIIGTESEFSKHLQMLPPEITDPGVVWDALPWCWNTSSVFSCDTLPLQSFFRHSQFLILIHFILLLFLQTKVRCVPLVVGAGRGYLASPVTASSITAP